MATIHSEDMGELDPATDLGKAWEELAQQHPASGVMQSLHWAAFKRSQGYKTLHLGLFEGQRLVGGAIGYAADTQHAGLLVIPEGPILPWADTEGSRAGLRLLLDGAAAQVTPTQALLVRIEPRLSGPRPRFLREFRRAPLDLVPYETLYLNLAVSEQALLAQMRPKGRYNIRTAARHGVVTSEATTVDALPQLYAALAEAATRDQFFLEPYSFFVNLCSALMPAGHARIVLAEHDGDVLGALLLVTYGQRATYLYGGVTNTKRNLMAGYALQWAAIRRAQADGCTLYDFYGYEPYNTPDHPYAGFSRFKRQFGGTPLRFIGAHDYVFIDRLADLVVRIAQETSGVSIPLPKGVI